MNDTHGVAVAETPLNMNENIAYMYMMYMNTCVFVHLCLHVWWKKG